MDSFTNVETWEDFVHENLLSVIAASLLFELQEATGLNMQMLEFMQHSLSEDEYVEKILSCSSRTAGEIADSLSWSEPWLFGFSDLVEVVE